MRGTPPDDVSFVPGTRPPTEVGARALRFRRQARRIFARECARPSQQGAVMTTPATALPYKVSDLSLAEFGRK